MALRAVHPYITRLVALVVTAVLALLAAGSMPEPAAAGTACTKHGEVRAEKLRNRKARASSSDAGELTKLAVELGRLRQALEAGASGPDEHAAAEAVGAAAEAAAQHDEPTMREYLAKAGQWALDAATRLGLPIAQAAIMRGLGLA